MAATDFGRPIVAPPGIPADRLKILREAFLKTMNDPELLAEAKRKNFDITPSTGAELESLAKLVMNQPARSCCAGENFNGAVGHPVARA